MTKVHSSNILDKLQSMFSTNCTTQRKTFDKLLATGLPDRKSESYKFTPIERKLATYISWDRKGELPIFQPTWKYQSSSNGSHIVFVNGQYSPQNSSVDHIIIDQTKCKGSKNDPFSLLNTSFATEELNIKPTTDQHTLFIYHLVSNGLVCPRIKIIVDNGLKINIVEKMIAVGNDYIFNNSYLELTIHKNGMVNHSKIQNYNEKLFTHETTQAYLKRDSKYYNNTFSFSGELVRNNLSVNIEEENVEAYIYGLSLLKGKSHVDHQTVVNHISPNSYSNELYKGVVDEQATSIFNGKIYVRKDAQKTNAFQSNNNLLLSDNATIHTKPQLEIWADDVKCSHGCTTGQLDEDAIFYLKARGIQEDTAKEMLIRAFVNETLNYVVTEELSSEIDKLIYQTLS